MPHPGPEGFFENKNKGENTVSTLPPILVGKSNKTISELAPKEQ